MVFVDLFHNVQKKGVLLTVLVLVACLGSLIVAVLHMRYKMSPDVVVERFYRDWIALAASDRSAPAISGLHTESMYVTESFANDVDRAMRKGGDAVLCTGPVPAQIVVDSMRENAAKTSANVDVRSGSVMLRILLVRDKLGWWRINEVDCPMFETSPENTASSTPVYGTTT